MKKNKATKILSVALASTVVLGMSTAAFAENRDVPDFTKTYQLTNDGTVSPAETFKFTYTADHATDTSTPITAAQMPTIPASEVSFKKGEATKDGTVLDVPVSLSDVQWPSVGVYYYKVNEVAGNTAGVTYDSNEAYLKVTVAYNEDMSTYYVAFVTLNLEDTNGDGITDEKSLGLVNVYSAGELQITKNVTGNLGDRNAYFDVTVTLSGEEGKAYEESYEVGTLSSEENPTSIKIGEATTFHIKHGETIDIKNLPYGVTYTVAEADYTTADKGGYDEAQYSYDDDNKKIDTPLDTVTITNNKGVVIDAGITMNSMPYIIVLAVAGIGIVVFFSRKRMMRK